MFYIYRAFYLNTQHYGNVVATQNPGSVLDAVMLGFAEDTFVDITKSIGYTHGGTT